MDHLDGTASLLVLGLFNGALVVLSVRKVRSWLRYGRREAPRRRSGREPWPVG
jgi:hypothetical protein